jgi:hypothetical protein
MKLLNITVLTTGILFIQGCGLSWFADPMQQPIIEDKLGSTGFRTLSTTSSRRVVIFNQQSKRLCAEPPPDVADNLTSAFATALEGSNGTVGAKAEISKAFASTATQLFQRSQGVQLYRDGMYSLCQAYLNGIIDGKVLLIKMDELLEKCKELIEAEINKRTPSMDADVVSTPLVPLTPKVGSTASGAQPATPIKYGTYNNVKVR